MSGNNSLSASTASSADSLISFVEINPSSTKSKLNRKFSSNLSLDETQYDKSQKLKLNGCGKKIENMQKRINTFCTEITKNLSIINEKLNQIDRSILEMAPKKEAVKNF
uniref:BLOC-1-related complex subunit 7 n=1 Tax=Strongyloides papillosus TaxID=174720 RepID=A0A0N5CAJ9_STREA